MSSRFFMQSTLEHSRHRVCTADALSVGGLPVNRRYASAPRRPGLSLAKSGLVSGTPTQPGSWSFWVNLSDQDPPSADWHLPAQAQREFTITINASRRALRHRADAVTRTDRQALPSELHRGRRGRDGHLERSRPGLGSIRPPESSAADRSAADATCCTSASRTSSARRARMCQSLHPPFGRLRASDP
jgi:hypothetical protein